VSLGPILPNPYEPEDSEPSSPEQPEEPRKGDLFDAKEGVHSLFLSYILGLVVAILLVVLAFSIAAAGATSSTQYIIVNGEVVSVSSPAAAGDIALILLLIVPASLLVLALQYRGFKLLASYNRSSYGVGLAGVYAMLVSLVPAAIALAVIASGGLSSAVGLVLLAGIMALIGKVLIWVALWRLSDEWMGGAIKVGVVLDALALIPFLGFLGLIAGVLYLVGLHSVEKNMEASIVEESG